MRVCLGKCPCGALVCTRCMSLERKGPEEHMCANTQISRVDTASKEIFARVCKKCPACGNYVQKTEGCNVMMCGTNAHGRVRDALRNGGCACIFNWNTLKPMKDNHGYYDINNKRVKGDFPRTDRQIYLNEKGEVIPQKGDKKVVNKGIITGRTVYLGSHFGKNLQCTNMAGAVKCVNTNCLGWEAIKFTQLVKKKEYLITSLRNNCNLSCDKNGTVTFSNQNRGDSERWAIEVKADKYFFVSKKTKKVLQSSPNHIVKCANTNRLEWEEWRVLFNQADKPPLPKPLTFGPGFKAQEEEMKKYGISTRFELCFTVRGKDAANGNQYFAIDRPQVTMELVFGEEKEGQVAVMLGKELHVPVTDKGKEQKWTVTIPLQEIKKVAPLIQKRSKVVFKVTRLDGFGTLEFNQNFGLRVQGNDVLTDSLTKLKVGRKHEFYDKDGGKRHEWVKKGWLCWKETYVADITEEFYPPV